MVEIKFIIQTERLRNPKLVIKLITEHIRLICGDCYIEAPEGYLKKGDLNEERK